MGPAPCAGALREYDERRQRKSTVVLAVKRPGDLEHGLDVDKQAWHRPRGFGRWASGERRRPPARGPLGSAGEDAFRLRVGELRCAVARAGRALRLGSQRRLRERIKLRDCGARNPEDLTPASPKGDPGFECGDALGAEALEERLR